MASGFFPFDRSGPFGEGEELLKVAERLRQISAEYFEYTALNSTPEDAAADGGYLERLDIAADFIEHCVKPEKE